ncbi:uncharacterized protein GLRG_10832 [Colletotrichum graminicola M1.001]|uniref:Rhodopsin domain-containing protein n=1 Tax=Colletotrichum graminicola (strain M1.001 / M2 / FGSC 10212) TaxID=645133 RepID=E3QXT9_COLGM|nr:uncharacterized protein GLRG_10832 [Colletotrichum graminicola M1.001]EFQ35677.1 hypothetical protein GLRG_10832 [Colletotrichum graminicola M1.001]
MCHQAGVAQSSDSTLPSPQKPEDVLHSIAFVTHILAVTLVSTFMVLRFPSSYFTKLSLLSTTIRVFKLHRKTVIGTYVFIVFLTLYTIPVFFVKTLICQPIAGYWDPEITTTCFNQRDIYLADTTISAATDMAVLCLPIPVALTLRMAWHKRLKVIVMLSSGGVATAASLVRLVVVIKLRESSDVTITLMRVTLLGTAEVSIGLICACLPAINILCLRGCNASGDSDQNTRGSDRIIELKFLKGSKLRTQHMATEVRQEDANHEEPLSPPQEEARRSYIFPFERVRHPPPAQVGTDTERATIQDEWYSGVLTSPFSEAGASDWSRKAAGP